MLTKLQRAESIHSNTKLILESPRGRPLLSRRPVLVPVHIDDRNQRVANLLDQPPNTTQVVKNVRVHILVLTDKKRCPLVRKRRGDGHNLPPRLADANGRECVKYFGQAIRVVNRSRSDWEKERTGIRLYKQVLEDEIVEFWRQLNNRFRDWFRRISVDRRWRFIGTLFAFLFHVLALRHRRYLKKLKKHDLLVQRMGENARKQSAFRSAKM
jgi:hypothetical protein